MKVVTHVCRTQQRQLSTGAFWMRPLASVALVGNGPLTEEQRQRISAANLVIRLNKMNNRHALCLRTLGMPVLAALCVAKLKPHLQHTSAVSAPGLGGSAGWHYTYKPSSHTPDSGSYCQVSRGAAGLCGCCICGFPAVPQAVPECMIARIVDS